MPRRAHSGSGHRWGSRAPPTPATVLLYACGRESPTTPRARAQVRLQPTRDLDAGRVQDGRVTPQRRTDRADFGRRKRIEKDGKGGWPLAAALPALYRADAGPAVSGAAAPQPIRRPPRPRKRDARRPAVGRARARVPSHLRRRLPEAARRPSAVVVPRRRREGGRATVCGVIPPPCAAAAEQALGPGPPPRRRGRRGILILQQACAPNLLAATIRTALRDPWLWIVSLAAARALAERERGRRNVQS